MKRRKAAEKERERLNIDVIENISNPSLKFEIEHFKLFGALKKSSTEVHNTIPNITSKFKNSAWFTVINQTSQVSIQAG